ncbi:hypothetical protein QQP08_004851, partial [Theobroma cacao]
VVGQFQLGLGTCECNTRSGEEHAGGETLYPLVQNLEPAAAAKVTGMFTCTSVFVSVITNSEKQRMEKAEVNASKNDLPQDFIDKQRAYSAEVDAFELEEEVASDEELEQMEKYMTKSFRI